MTIFTYPDVFNPVDAAGNLRGADMGEANVLAHELMTAVQMALFDGLIYSTRAALYADLAHAANSWALVIGDPTSGYDGIYRKSGASGAGSWSRVGDVPGSGFIKATDAGAGTANAIVATSPAIPATDGAALIALNIFEANTATPVTVAFNGGTALTIKTNSGNDVTVGGLAAGMIVAGYKSGTTFRLLSDQASAAILAAAEAAQAAAEAAQAAAEAAAASIAGLPVGGSTGQVLAKNSATNYDAGWASLGTAALKNTGTSGDAVPLLNAVNSWSAPQVIASSTADLRLDKTASGDLGRILGYTAGSLRWIIEMSDAVVESGSNAGSNFNIKSRTDAGAALTTPISISRATGLVVMAHGATVGDTSGDPVIIKGTTVDSFSSGLLDNADAAAWRTDLGLGSIATQAASAVAITGGSIAGITDLAVADGGTGASDAATARTNLGLVIGTNVQAYDAELAAIAGLTSAADRLPYFTGSGTASLATFTAAGRALVDDADAAAQRTTLGLGSAAVLTAGAASGNLKALNTDGAFTFATTATNTNVAGVNAGVWKTAHRIDSTDAATYAGNRTTMAILRGYTGSGENGPTRSDTALHLETEQDNWLTTSVLGEGDTLRIFNRKGVNGDTAGILINVGKVESASYGSLAWEAASSWVAATTGTIVRLMRTSSGHQGSAADLRGGGMGFNASAMTGDHGIAFAALQDHTDTGQWKYPFLGADGYANGDEYFYVTGPAHASGKGQLYTSGLAHIAGGVAAPAGGSTAAVIKLSNLVGNVFGIFFGSSAPTVTAAKGSLYLRRDGTTTNNRAYINTDGGTTWTALTTAA